MKKAIFITTPIYYVNAAPHLGHFYSTLLADGLARWHKSVKAQDTYFTTGTDEHGIKVQEASTLNGYSNPQLFCDTISNRFVQMCRTGNLQYDEFIRTTDRKHRQTVESVWNTLVDRGFISMGLHRSWYCKSDESFVTDMQVEDKLMQNGWEKVSKESGHMVEMVEEENYKFKLSAFEKPILKWLENNPNVIQPRTKHNEVVAAVKRGLQDLSVSRLKSNLQWGIPVPKDRDHVLYVWLDALSNYLTTSGYPDLKYKQMWPADYQVIGKDILKFHAIYWPAFLMALELPLPKSIIVHGHWTVEGVKMSKSLGNVICPTELVHQHGIDNVRYFLLREGHIGSDNNFSVQKLQERCDSDLANNFGNLVARFSNKALLPDRKLPTIGKLTPQDEKFLNLFTNLRENTNVAYTSTNFVSGITQIIHVLREANSYFTEMEPWVLAKRIKTGQTSHAADQDRLNTITVLCYEACRISAILLSPVIPNACHEILTYLKVPNTQRTYEHAKIDLSPQPNVQFDQFLIPFRKTRKSNP